MNSRRSLDVWQETILEIVHNCMLTRKFTPYSRFLVKSMGFRGVEYVDQIFKSTEVQEEMQLAKLTKGWKLNQTKEEMYWTLWYLILAVSLKDQTMQKYAATAGPSSVFVRSCMMRGPPKEMLDTMTLFGMQKLDKCDALPLIVADSGDDMDLKQFVLEAVEKIKQLPAVIKAVESALEKMQGKVKLKKECEIQNVALAMLVFCKGKKRLDRKNIELFMEATARDESMSWLWEASFKPKIVLLSMLAFVWNAFTKKRSKFNIKDQVQRFLDQNKDKKLPRSFVQQKAAKKAAESDLDEDDEEGDDNDEEYAAKPGSRKRRMSAPSKARKKKALDKKKHYHFGGDSSDESDSKVASSSGRRGSRNGKAAKKGGKDESDVDVELGASGETSD